VNQANFAGKVEQKMTYEPSPDQLKRDFLTIAFNQFKTPTNIVLELTQVLLEDKEGPLNEAQEQNLRYIYDAAQHLLHLIEQYLKNQSLTLDLAHAYDLRTLPNAIIGFSDELIQDTDSPINKTEIDVLACIKENGIGLLCLLNNILDAWRIEEYRAGENRLYVFKEITLDKIVEDFRFWIKN